MNPQLKSSPKAPRNLLPLSKLSATEANQIRQVYTDLDDTLTTEGQLQAPTFSALWKLYEAGIQVVIVTGRPAGWCDHIARMWPVAGVIGENGAFYFRYDPKKKKLQQHFLLSKKRRELLQNRLSGLAQKILRAVPGAALASDQGYRIHDLAIDFCEDVRPLSAKKIDRIVTLFEEAGATAKVSSIHVNGWFGDYNKIDMIRTFARDIFNAKLEQERYRKRALYVGDSPNDEPAFAYFENSVGVANIRAFTDQLQAPPRFVTRQNGGAGFNEIARKLIRSS